MSSLEGTNFNGSMTTLPATGRPRAFFHTMLLLTTISAPLCDIVDTGANKHWSKP